MRMETRCRHIGYSFRLAARVLLYAPSHRQDSTYHGLCYTSRGALAETRYSSDRATMKGRSDDLSHPRSYISSITPWMPFLSRRRPANLLLQPLPRQLHLYRPDGVRGGGRGSQTGTWAFPVMSLVWPP